MLASCQVDDIKFYVRVSSPCSVVRSAIYSHLFLGLIHNDFEKVIPELENIDQMFWYLSLVVNEMDLVCQGWFVLSRGSRPLSHFSFITQLLLQLACQPCRFFGWMYTLSISQYDNTTCKGIFFVVHIQDYQSGPCMPLVSAQSFWHHILVVHLSQVPLHWNQCWRIKLHTWVCIHRDFMHSCLNLVLVSPLPELGLEICLCLLLDASTGNKLLQHHACLYRLMSFVCSCVKSSWMYYSATWLLSLCFCFVANDICCVIHCALDFRW